MTAGLPSGMPSGTAGIKQIDSGGTYAPSYDARFQSDEAILPPTLSSPAVQGGRGPGASGVFPVEFGTFKHSNQDHHGGEDRLRARRRSPTASSSNPGAHYKQAVQRAKAQRLIEAIGDAGPAYWHGPASGLVALPNGMAQARSACRPAGGEAGNGFVSPSERQPACSPGPLAVSHSVAREHLLGSSAPDDVGG